MDADSISPGLHALSHDPCDDAGHIFGGLIRFVYKLVSAFRSDKKC